MQPPRWSLRCVQACMPPFAFRLLLFCVFFVLVQVLLQQCIASAQRIAALEEELRFTVPLTFVSSLLFRSEGLLFEFVLVFFVVSCSARPAVFQPWQNDICMWSRAVRDLFAELYVTCGLSQRKVPEVVSRVCSTLQQSADLPDDSLVPRALFERMEVFLLRWALTTLSAYVSSFSSMPVFSVFLCLFFAFMLLFLFSRTVTAQFTDIFLCPRTLCCLCT